MKILITGSHFTPAQAVIEQLLEIPDVEIVYLGRKYARDDDSAKSIESEILPKMGVKFIPITAGKLNRFFSFGTVVSFLKTPIGFVQSFYYLMKEQPDLIVSFGGFTGLPVVVCGWLLSIPSLIHEQGLRMGLSNFISSFFAQKIALSFAETKVSPFLDPAKIILTGNPIRKEFLNPSKPSKEIANFIEKAKVRKIPLILITAGNQGSRFINLNLEDKLLELTQKYCLIHQTGESKFDDFVNLKKNQSENYLVKKWIEVSDLNFILEEADLVICRAGVNTLIELSLKKAPALIIPIPIGSEQKENARFFVKLGLGETLNEEKITPQILFEKISEMINDKSSRKSIENTKNAVVLDAGKKLVLEILLMKNHKDNFNINF